MRQGVIVAMATLILLLLAFKTGNAQEKGGRWRFENNGEDTAEWDLHEDTGTCLLASFGSAPPLCEGDAYLFLDTALVNDFFRVDDSSDLDFTNENLAISAWIYAFQTGDDVHWILNKGDQYKNPKTTNYSLRISKTRKLEFLVRDASNRAQSVASSFDIPVDEWTFVAVYYDYSAGKVMIWNDAESAPVDTLDFRQDLISNEDPLSIGTWYASDPGMPTIKSFNGRIDDVRISGRLSDVLTNSSAVTPAAKTIPGEWVLAQNYPNPFNNETLITFVLAEESPVSLRIYNLNGQEVCTLICGLLPAGRHSVSFKSASIAGGVYSCRLSTSGGTYTRKMILVK